MPTRAIGFLLLALAVMVPQTAGAWTFSPADVFTHPITDVIFVSDGNVVVTARETLLKLDGVTGAELWRTARPGFPGPLAELPSGDVVVLGSRVAAHDAATGAELWVHNGGCANCRLLAITPDGGVVVAGSQGFNQLFVIRLDGATGAVEWGHHDPTRWAADGVGVTPNGTVIVGAGSHIIALDGSTGSVAWDIEPEPAGGRFRGLLGNPEGHVFVAGSTVDPLQSVHTLTALGLDGATGDELWRQTDPAPGGYAALAMLPSGDLVAAGTGGQDLQAVALSSVDGALIWHWAEAAPPSGPPPILEDLSMDGAGDVALTADFGPSGNPTDGFAAKLAGSTGSLVWQHRFQLQTGGSANGVAHDAAGDVVFVGDVAFALPLGATGRHYIVRKLRGADGESFVGTRCGNAVCDRCERCASPDVCEVGPRSDCRLPNGATGSVLQLRRGATPASDRLLWRWGKGLPSLPADLGDPRISADETLCVYADAAANPSLTFSDTVAGLEDFGTASCWRYQFGQASKPVFNYRSGTVTPAGKSTFAIKLMGGPKSSMRWKARGPALDLPTLGLAAPVRAELRSSTGVCWAANYAAGIADNTPTAFKAKGGP